MVLKGEKELALCFLSELKKYELVRLVIDQKMDLNVHMYTEEAFGS